METKEVTTTKVENNEKGKEKKKKDKSRRVSIFMEDITVTEDGKEVKTYSMRRTCAFIMFIVAALLGLLSIILPLVTAIINYVSNQTFSILLDWKVTLVCIGVPAIIGVLLLFITSWQDIQSTIKDVTGALKK